MSIKILQLNIKKGLYINEIIPFVKNNDFDVLHFQEIGEGKLSLGKEGCFEILSKVLTEYNHSYSPCFDVIGDSGTSLGNATFVKNHFKINNKHEIWFKEFQMLPFQKTYDWKEVPRNALAVSIEYSGNKLCLINTHFPWSPTSDDTSNKFLFGRSIYDYIAQTNQPFILTGDFNSDPSTEVVSLFDKLGSNLIKKYNIDNTLNPDTHRIKKLFPPGLAVDYIITHPQIKVSNFSVVKSPDLSDHYGLQAELEP